ncbi:MAG: hypothetical protein HZB51_20560 [Chloroflexi bacterium]|nr:hypothetical protein [Chloroflexota bacterium]
MKTLVTSPTLNHILLYGLIYILWFVNIVVCVAALAQVRSLVSVLWIAAGNDVYSFGLINSICLLVGGIVAFTFVMFLEGYYRASFERPVQATASPDQSSIRQKLTNWKLDILLRRFAMTTAIPLGVLIVAWVALEIALRILVR